MRIFVLDLFTNVLDKRQDLLLNHVKIRLADESRVPNVYYAVYRLIDVIRHEGNKEYDDVACHHIKIIVVDGNYDELVVASRDLSNGLDNISKITRNYTTA